MYQWVVFLHVLSALLFMLAHGVSSAVMWQMRSVRDKKRIYAMMEFPFPPFINQAMRGSFYLIFITGIVAGIMGGWWRQGWFWVSLGLLVGIFLAMRYLGTNYFGRVWEAGGFQSEADQQKGLPPPTPVSEEAFAKVLASGQPILLAVVGLGGITIILWLMMFKPF